ncbi:phage tail protein [Hoeflea sp. G2-23]|uniref:Phage tail protein n=1 Tax=Hoeflea algicola TaxID=2983763 RepID=A0ABT3Z2Z6_9HYPH|nr:phage tail protein [Hoeflea algicola]MCY0146143.1 phage tail protein [Hoeflea algicola]MCY0150873.1 phage tail protein [Hoeflea algicola]
MVFSLIGGAIAAAVGLGSATLFGVSAGAIIGGGLALAANLALSYLNRPKKTLSTAVQGQVQLGGDVADQVLFGTGKTKGHRIYYAKYGGGNAQNAEVFVLANGRCDGLEEYIYFYGEKHDLISVTPVDNEAARYTVDGFGSSINIRFYDGSPGQLADSELVAATSALGNPWKATSTVAGHAYVVVERTWSASLFDKGRPEFEFVLRGWCEYDPRKDSTVSGGSGSHRIDDPDTWEHSVNPAIHRLNFQLGLRGTLSGDVLVGVGKPISQIDVAMHMAAANVCDTERTIGGRTIPTYHCNLFVSAEDDHIAVLQMMEDAMAGYAVNRAGLDGVLAGAPQVPVLEITADGIRADAPRKSKNRRSGFDGINILSGQFTSIEAHYNPESLETVSSNADIAADGRKRPAGNDFLQVTDPDIAQYLLNIRYRQNRKAKQRSLPVSRKVGTRLQPGDWVTYEDTDWLITKWGFDRQFQFTLELAETGDDVYDEEGITAGPVIVAPSAPANPSLISTVSNFTVAAGLITGTNGAQTPALQFGWDDPEDPTVTAVQIQYRQNGTESPVFTATATDVAAGTLVMPGGVQSVLDYDARATISTQPDRLKSWTSWVTTVAPTQTVQLMLAEVAGDIRGTLDTMRAQIDDLHHRIELSGGDASMDTTERYLERRVITRQQGALKATVISEQQARIDGDAALAEDITAVEAMAEGANAGGLFKIEASAGAGDVLSRLTMYARASIEDAFEDAGLVIEVVGDGEDPPTLSGRVVISAAQFVVTDGTETNLPLVFEDGVLKIQNILFGDGVGGTITGATGKMVSDYVNERMTFSD